MSIAFKSWVMDQLDQKFDKAVDKLLLECPELSEQEAVDIIKDEMEIR